MVGLQETARTVGTAEAARYSACWRVEDDGVEAVELGRHERRPREVPGLRRQRPPGGGALHCGDHIGFKLERGRLRVFRQREGEAPDPGIEVGDPTDFPGGVADDPRNRFFAFDARLKEILPGQSDPRAAEADFRAAALHQRLRSIGAGPREPRDIGVLRKAGERLTDFGSRRLGLA